MTTLRTCFAQRGGDGDGDGDTLPGTPWTPKEPSPDGGSPEGDGKHRK
ncbi:MULTISPECIES: hypothetical protein [unclassified Streptomyces]|nr:hypothetical protein [Streptomyces sp. NBC_00223]